MHVPLQDEDVATWRAFLEAHAALLRAVERDLAHAGLPPAGWYDVLLPLYEADGRRLRMAELAERVLISRTGLTRLVDRVEAAGLLRREPVPGDRRGTYVVLTAAGRGMLRRMWKVYARTIQEQFVPQVGNDWPAFARVLDRLRG
jgi:DNA-binding MarR family transcriptional regulator